MNDQNMFGSAMIPATMMYDSDGRNTYSISDHGEAVAYGEPTFEAGTTSLPNSHDTLASIFHDQEALYTTSGTNPETARCIAVPPRAILRSQPLNSSNEPHSLHAGMAPKKPALSRRKKKSHLAVREHPKVTTRESSACWRCRKYKKPCRGEPICTSCLNSGFRVWPSELGCRRERLHTLIDCFVPARFELGLPHIPPITYKLPSWRQIRLPVCDDLPHSTREQGHWTTLKQHLQSILIFGHDLDGIVDLAKQYQQERSHSFDCLETACDLLIATCQLYKCFVQTTVVELIPASETIEELVKGVRHKLHRTFVLIERLCLASKPIDWLEATFSVTLASVAAIVFIDCMILAPPEARESIYGDSIARRGWIRQVGYNILIDLLRANTKGVNPLKLSCFDPPDSRDKNVSDSRETLLPPLDAASLTAGRKLKEWTAIHSRSMLEAQSMLDQGRYHEHTIPPTGSLVKVYAW